MKDIAIQFGFVMDPKIRIIKNGPLACYNGDIKSVLSEIEFRKVMRKINDFRLKCEPMGYWTNGYGPSWTCLFYEDSEDTQIIRKETDSYYSRYYEELGMDPNVVATVEVGLERGTNEKLNRLESEIVQIANNIFDKRRG